MTPTVSSTFPNANAEPFFPSNYVKKEALNANAEPFFPSNYPKEEKARYAKILKESLAQLKTSPSSSCTRVSSSEPTPRDLPLFAANRSGNFCVIA